MEVQAEQTDNTIIDLLETDFNKAVKEICQEPDDKDVEKWIKQYNNRHDILDKSVKPDKIIETDEGTTVVKLNRLPIPLQRKIVNSAVAFLFGDPVNFYQKDAKDGQKASPAFEAIQKVWDDQKLDSVNKKLARRLFSETMVAELWFAVIRDDEKKLKVKILSKKDGDTIYPYFDQTGDMVAFARKYELKDEKNKPVQHIDIYTADKTYLAKELNGKYELEIKPNVFGKIPVVYYEIDHPIWYFVQAEIDRLEKLLSGHADTNDYFGSPSLKIFGELENAPDKDTAGKLFQFKGEPGQDGKMQYGDMSYLTWDQSPESISLEINNLKDLIHSMTATPDLSFNNLRDIGTKSGLSMRFMFLDAEIEASNNQEIFDEGLTRRFSILKTMLGMMNFASKGEFDKIEIDYEYGSILPQDLKELIEMLSTGRVGKPLFSKRTAAKNIPFIEDVEQELQEMDNESQADAQQSLQIAESFNAAPDNQDDEQEN